MKFWKNPALWIVALGIATATLIFPAIRIAEGATTAPFSSVASQEDRIDPYDYTQRDGHSNLTVDWPVNLVFWNDAEIDRVKDRMDPVFPVKYPAAGRMFEYFNNGAGWESDQDGGRKMQACESSDKHEVVHFRMYAPYPADRFYNRAWGYYIVATSHQDTNECYAPASGPQWFGESEKAEDKVAFWASVLIGSNRVVRDAMWFQNREPYRQQGNHIWSNNGYATFIKLG